MKILVVGSKGFIGSHCVEHFRKEHEVTECDVILDYTNSNYISIDSVDSDFLELFSSRQFDLCINCSGAANVPFSLTKPFNDFKLNTLNVFKILDAIRQNNPDCKFLTLSSAAVYGNPNRLPITTEDGLSPVSPYGYHKCFAEKICEEYNKFWGIKTCCIRIFSAYGPRLKKQLFWDLYNKFVSDEQINLWGTGMESRDFIYVTDLVNAIDVVIKNSDFENEIVNVANGKQITISEVANTFVKVMGSSKKILFNGQVRAGDPINWEADISKIKEWGYFPCVSLEQGIKNYIQWIRNL